MLAEEVQALKNEIRPSSGWGKPTQGIRVKELTIFWLGFSLLQPCTWRSILGYITRGRGISIHRSDCRNIITYMQSERERLVEVAWDEEFTDPFRLSWK